MSGNTIELIIRGNSKEGQAAVLEMQRVGANAASILEREFDQLGTKSSLAFERQRQAATTAYERIKSSGMATADELSRSERAHIERMKEIDRAQHGTVESTFHLNNAWSTMATILPTIGVGMLAREMLQAQVAIDKVRATLNTTFGAQSAEELQFLEHEADRLGLVLNASALAYGRISAASKGTSMEGDKTRLTFIGVTEAATALGLSGIEVEGILTALQQMLSKGTVQAEELQGQLGERLPGAIKLAADAMGVSERELRKMMERGELMASDLLPRLAQALHEKYGKAAEEASNSAQAGINRVENAYQELLRTAATELPIAEGLNAAADGLRLVAEHADAVALGLAAMGAATVVQNIGAITTAVRALAGSTALATGGITLLTGAVAILAFEAGEKLVEAYDAQGEAALGAMEMMKSHGDTAKNTAAVLAGAAEQAALAAEREKKALEIAKKAQKERADSFRERAKEIIDIEKERISESENLEKAHLDRLKNQYAAAVSALDQLIDTRAALKTTLNDAADSALPTDGLNRFLALQDKIRAGEEAIDGTWADPAEKAKRYAALITEAGKYREAVSEGGAELISTYEAEARYQATKERLGTKINELLDSEIATRTAAAETEATAMIAAQGRMETYVSTVRELDSLVRALPKVVDISVNLKVAGMSGLAAVTGAAGYQNFGDYYTAGGKTYWKNGELADNGTSFTEAPPPKVLGTNAVGTRYIARTGNYQLHQGEEVRTRSEVTASRQAPSITIAPTIQILGTTAGGRDKTGRELMRELEPFLVGEIRKINARSRN